MNDHSDDANRAESLLPNLAHALATGDSSALKKERTYWENTLPADLVSDDYASSGFTEDDLTFQMVELTPDEQEKAAELGGQSSSAISREMLFASLYKIGDWEPRRNRDKLEDWYKAIGPKCTSLLQAAFVQMQSVEEKDINTFLAAGKKGRG